MIVRSCLSSLFLRPFVVNQQGERTKVVRGQTTYSRRRRSLVGWNDSVIDCVVQRVLYLSPSFVASFVPCTQPVCLYRVANVCSMRKEDRLSWPDTSFTMEITVNGTITSVISLSNFACTCVSCTRTGVCNQYVTVYESRLLFVAPSYLLVLYTRFSTSAWYYASSTSYWYVSATACMLLCTNIAP